MSTESSPSWPAPPARYRLTLTKVTSYVILTQRQRVTFTGSPADLEAAYKKVQAHNWVAGWWGFPVGLVWTPIMISRNSGARRKLRGLVGTGASAPGWFTDPSGRHTRRYWSGTAWTDQVSDEGTDAVPAST